MSSLYDTLLKRNTVTGAFEAWAEYRKALTAFILECAQGDSCLIVGAGACNDIDTAQLAARFSRVTLLDTDTAAMDRALERCPGNNITALRADILGVFAERYRALDAEMTAGINAGQTGAWLTAAFLGRLDRMMAEARPDPLPMADTVICCGVHSQLLAMFARMAAVYARYAAMDTQRIFERISRQNAELQPAFNTRLLKAARATLITGLETGRAGMPGGIEGASQALADLAARQLSGVQTELLWPFDRAQGKLYTVRAAAFETRGR